MRIIFCLLMMATSLDLFAQRYLQRNSRFHHQAAIEADKFMSESVRQCEQEEIPGLLIMARSVYQRQNYCYQNKKMAAMEMRVRIWTRQIQFVARDGRSHAVVNRMQQELNTFKTRVEAHRTAMDRRMERGTPYYNWEILRINQTIKHQVREHVYSYYLQRFEMQAEGSY